MAPTACDVCWRVGGCAAYAPSVPPAFDAVAYQGRNVVERCFNRLKDWRAIATRYDKRGLNYLVAVTYAAIVLWIGGS